MKGYTIDYYLTLNDEERNREMYALFGHCVYSFQLIEHQLMNMILVYYKSKNIALEENEYNMLFKNYSNKTMGKLIGKVVSLYSLEKSKKRILLQINKKRNFFVHHYFKNRNIKLFSENGEIEIINEINEVDDLLIDMDKYLVQITKPLIEVIGITDDYINYGVELIKEGKFIDVLKFPE